MTREFDRLRHDRTVYALAILSLIADIFLMRFFSRPVESLPGALLILACLMGTQFMVIKVPRRNGRAEILPTSSLWLIMLVLLTPLLVAPLAMLVGRAIFHRMHGGGWREWSRSSARIMIVSSMSGIFFTLISNAQDRDQIGYFTPGGVLLFLTTSYLYMALMVASNVFDIAYRDGVSLRSVFADEADLRLRLHAIFASVAPILALVAHIAPWVVPVALISLFNTRFTAKRMMNFYRRALLDQLTGIGNRAAFTLQIEEALVQAKEADQHAGVLMLDIDRFKQINDTLGHPAGDLVVNQIGQRLSTELPCNATPFRLGGDEFVILVKNADEADLHRLSQQLLELVARPVSVAELGYLPMAATSRLVVSTSIGVAIYPQHGSDGTELLKNADRAMYEAKKENNTACFYTEALCQIDIEDLELVADLHEAVALDAFEVHYQPKICALSGSIMGMEALVRWNHPQRGYISPEIFVPMAEQAGLIIPLTNIVGRQSIVTLKMLHEQGHLIDLSVNISAQMLASLAINDWLDQVEAMPDLPLDFITLEITESAMGENARTEALMQRLRRYGAKLSIDDYGTGFSSLSRLADLHPEELKIDKSFVWKLEDPRTNAIVASTIAMCKALGISTVAEGVETQEMVDQLTEMGCDIFQGYFFAKPMPMAQLVTWLDQRAAVDQGEDLQISAS